MDQLPTRVHPPTRPNRWSPRLLNIKRMVQQLIMWSSSRAATKARSCARYVETSLWASENPQCTIASKRGHELVFFYPRWGGSDDGYESQRSLVTRGVLLCVHTPCVACIVDEWQGEESVEDDSGCIGARVGGVDGVAHRSGLGEGVEGWEDDERWFY